MLLGNRHGHAGSMCCCVHFIEEPPNSCSVWFHQSTPERIAQCKAAHSLGFGAGTCIWPSSNALSLKQSKECYSSKLSEQDKRSLNWLMPQVSKLHEIPNQSPNLYFVQPAERGPTAVGFVQIRQRSQCNKNLPDCSNTCKFIRNATQDSVDP